MYWSPAGGTKKAVKRLWQTCREPYRRRIKQTQAMADSIIYITVESMSGIVTEKKKTHKLCKLWTSVA